MESGTYAFTNGPYCTAWWAAKRLGVTPQSIRNYVRQKRLRWVVKVALTRGKTKYAWLIPVTEIERLREGETYES